MLDTVAQSGPHEEERRDFSRTLNRPASTDEACAAQRTRQCKEDAVRICEAEVNTLRREC